jgi:hypothetical protein
MHTVVALQPQRIFEVAPRRTLRGFFRAIDHSVESVTNIVSARRATARSNPLHSHS